MIPDSLFIGFKKGTITFLKKLKANNNKQWFEENRDRFNDDAMQPAQEFVIAMGNKLRVLAPNIIAIPKTDKTIFRIHRDVRFSPNKTPYKTHLAFFFWDGPRKKLENPGFYMHIDPPNILLYTGLYKFPKHLLPVYRDAIVHPEHGPALVKAIKKATKNSDFELGTKHYKKTPRGYDAEHPLAEWLLYNGIGLRYEAPIPQELFTAGFINYCFKQYRKMAPLHDWLCELSQRAQR